MGQLGPLSAYLYLEAADPYDVAEWGIGLLLVAVFHLLYGELARGFSPWLNRHVHDSSERWWPSTKVKAALDCVVVGLVLSWLVSEAYWTGSPELLTYAATFVLLDGILHLLLAFVAGNAGRGSAVGSSLLQIGFVLVMWGLRPDLAAAAPLAIVVAGLFLLVNHITLAVLARWQRPRVAA